MPGLGSARGNTRVAQWMHGPFSTSFSVDFPQYIHPHPQPLPEQRAVIAQDRLGGVVAGGAGDAAAGMGAGAAMVEALQGPAVIGVAQHRAGREQLVQRQRAMKDVAAEQAEL